MRKNYVKPALISEEFVPQTYVAACEGQVTWSIKCNVPEGYGYLDNNQNNKYDSGDTLLCYGVHGCDETHNNVVLPEGVSPYDTNARWHESRSGKDYPVFYWTDGDGYYDKHFTKGNPGDAVKNMS